MITAERQIHLQEQVSRDISNKVDSLGKYHFKKAIGIY